MEKLKTVPEDFVVTERSTITPKDNGNCSYAWMQKRNLTTMDAVARIAKALHVPTKRIGYAGNKDKHAMTEQFISLEGISAEQIESLHLPQITLTADGYGDRVVGLGALEGNEFTIVVRNIITPPTPITQFPNYFDAQRFSRHNAKIGKLIIQRKFADALSLIGKRSDHPLNSLRCIPKKLLSLYVHAYQSMLFNTIVAAHLITYPHTLRRELFGNLVFPKEKVKNFSVPLPGFGFFCADAALAGIIESLLREEGICMEDFVIREFPELSCESIERDAFAEIQDLQIGKLEDDEIHKGKKKCTISFFLQKGSYATMAVKGMFV